MLQLVAGWGTGPGSGWEGPSIIQMAGPLLRCTVATAPLLPLTHPTPPSPAPQMLAGQQAWSELASPMQIIYAVGVQRRRLPIPPGCPPPIARLLKDW